MAMHSLRGSPTSHAPAQGAPPGDKDDLPAVIVDLADHMVGGVPLGLSHLRGRDEDLKLQALAQLEEHAEVVLGQAVCLVEKEHAQRAGRPPVAQQVGGVFPKPVGASFFWGHDGHPEVLSHDGGSFPGNGVGR